MKKLFTTVITLLFLSAATVYGTSISGTPIVCTGLTTALTIDTVGGTWSSDDTTIAKVTAAGVVSGIFSGTTIISYNLPLATYTMSIAVSQGPLPSMGWSTVCVGATAALDNAMGSGTWSSSAPAVASIGTWSGTLKGLTAGTAIVTFTAYTGCFTTRVQTVNPVPDPITGADSIYVTGSTVLNSATPGGVWSSSTPSVASIGTSGTLTGLVAGGTTVLYTMSTGCTRSLQITVLNMPVAVNEPIAAQLLLFSVYPNPTSGTFLINSNVRGEVKIYSTEGREFGRYSITTNTTTVKLPVTLPAGVYTCLFIGDDGNTKTQRFVYKP